MSTKDTLRIIAKIRGSDPSEVRIGMAVEVCFEQRGDTRPPQFRLTAPETCPIPPLHRPPVLSIKQKEPH